MKEEQSFSVCENDEEELDEFADPANNSRQSHAIDMITSCKSRFKKFLCYC